MLFRTGRSRPLASKSIGSALYTPFWNPGVPNPDSTQVAAVHSLLNRTPNSSTGLFPSSWVPRLMYRGSAGTDSVPTGMVPPKKL
jgi:hypothetical protein